MHESKKGLLPSKHEIALSKDQSPKTLKKIEYMRQVSHAYIVRSFMYVISYPRQNIYYIVGMVNRY